MLSPATLRALFALVCPALPVCAFALLAATPEQVLCNAGQIVVVEVITGQSADCRLRYQSCSPQDVARLQVKIIDVLAVGDDSAFRRFGAAMRDSRFTEAPHEVRTAPVTQNQIVDVTVPTSSSPNAPLTDAQVIERYRGKRLLLSLGFGGGVLPLIEDSIDKSVKRGPATTLPAGSDLYGQIWPMERREWVEKTIFDRNGNQCPQALVVNGRSSITYKPPVTEADIIAEALRLQSDTAYTWFEIGNWYSNGEHGLQKSLPDALQWYLKAAEQGYDVAQRRVGEMYEFGEGVRADHEKALEWIGKVDAASPYAAIAIAKKHEGGRGYPKDLKRAEEWYLLGANRDFPAAQNQLGEFYEACGEQYLPQALRWYRQAASAQIFNDTAPAQAMANLGKLYAAGKGVPQDYAEAASWYLRSVTSGGYWGQYGLAMLYEQGLGVPQDANKALELYYEVALLDDAVVRRLFALFEKGMNVPAGDEAAIAWYRKAAKKGDARARAGLGLRYKFHKGVERNWSVAYALFNLANRSPAAKTRVPDFSGPPATAAIYMTRDTWALVDDMARPGNFLAALDDFIAHPPQDDRHAPGRLDISLP